MLGRAGLRDTCFIAMSNYYYEEKPKYLATLRQVSSEDYDLTSFLLLGLEGIKIQIERLMDQIRKQAQKLLFRDTMNYFSERLVSPRKRAITERQFKILQVMLKHEEMNWIDLKNEVRTNYSELRQPLKAFIRDIAFLDLLRALSYKIEEKEGLRGPVFRIDLEWPTKITETSFYKTLKEFPKAKSSFPTR